MNVQIVKKKTSKHLTHCHSDLFGLYNRPCRNVVLCNASTALGFLIFMGLGGGG